MWNSRKSLVLSKVFTIVFMVLLVAMLCVGPRLVEWLMRYSIAAQTQHTVYFLITFYSGGVAAACLLFCLYRLLGNISKNQLFIPENITLLRRISWCCLLGAGICLLSSFYYVAWGVVGIAAAFMGLIVRVVKNLVAQAVLLKEENDLTV